MKKKIYSIALLLSFLVVLGHQMIPHHHENTLDNFSKAHNPIKEHSHYDDHRHHHHENDQHDDDSKKTNDSHNHSFPLHNHTIASDEYSIARLTVVSETTLKVISFNVPTAYNAISVAIQLTDDKQKLYSDKPFLINSIFQPGAIGLRAPPSMA